MIGGGNDYVTVAGFFAKLLNYMNEGDYLDAFLSPEGRADMADRFVHLATKHGLSDLTVYYE